MNSHNGNIKRMEPSSSCFQRSITPAILGIPSVSHGAKLSATMSSQDKEELLARLDAWRKKRADKLAASVLAKGKQLNKPNASIQPKQGTKLISISQSEHVVKTNQTDVKKNVFNRLYESANNKSSDKHSEDVMAGKSNFPKRLQNAKHEKGSALNVNLKIPEIIITEESDENKTEKIISNEVEDSVYNEQSSETISRTGLSDDVPDLHLAGNKDLDENNSQNEKKMDEEDNMNYMEGDNSNKLSEPELKSNESMMEKNHSSPDNSDFKEGKCSDNLNMGAKSIKVKPSKNDSKCIISKKKKPAPRKSISRIFRTKCGSIANTMHRTNSENNLESVKEEKNGTDLQENDNDKKIPEENKSEEIKRKSGKNKTVCFKTPEEKTLSAVHLRNKLEDWLTENGHSVDTYRHLGYFGIATEGTPGTPYHRIPKNDESSNTSFYTTAPNTPIPEIIDESDKENVTPPTHVLKFDIKDAERWLGDLHRLIINLKYPGERCEEWLMAISRKFPNCDGLPLYWECLAALGENKNFKFNENEERSNEEVSTVDSSLVNLFDNMVIDESRPSASKITSRVDPKNVIKSRAVKFAVREKSVKQMDPLLGKETCQKVLVATPVRRSTRIQTPDKSNVYTSLKSLDPEMKESVSFKSNDAILTG